MSEVVLTIAQTLRLFRFYTQWPIFNKFQFHQALKFSVTYTYIDRIHLLRNRHVGQLSKAVENYSDGNFD